MYLFFQVFGVCMLMGFIIVYGIKISGRVQGKDTSEDLSPETLINFFKVLAIMAIIIYILMWSGSN